MENSNANKAVGVESDTHAPAIKLEDDNSLIASKIPHSKILPPIGMPAKVNPHDVKDSPTLSELIKKMPEAIDEPSKLPAFDFDDIHLYGDTVGIIVYKKKVSIFTSSDSTSKTDEIKMSFRAIVAKVGDKCSLDIQEGDIVAMVSELIQTPNVNPLTLLPVRKTTEKEYYLAVFPSTFFVARL